MGMAGQRRQVTSNIRKGAESDLFQPSYFKVKVKLDATDQIYPHKVYNEQKIKDIKGDLEFLTGIPSSLQKLWYLDEADLQDESDVRQNHIVPDGLLHVSVHYSWCHLVRAVMDNDVQMVFDLGVTENSDFMTPNVEFMTNDFRQPLARKQFYEERSFIALFLAAHMGHLDMCKKLVTSGSRVNRVTSCGRSPLHVAAACGHGDVMDLLLERGAKAHISDVYGETPSSVAIKFGHKDCDRHLFMFRWQQRAKRAKAKEAT